MEKREMNKIPPEKAMQILNQGGLNVNLEQTKLILDFLYKMAHIAITKCEKTEQRRAS